jgi:hypothetical protein
MSFVIVVFAASLSVQYALDWHVTDEDRARFKDIVMDFHTLASFLIGFFVSQCLSRWWSIRSNGIGGLWGNMDDICLLTACYFPKDTAEDREVREKVLRWLVLAHELIYKQVQEDSDLSDLERRGLLLEHEHRLIAPLASKSMVVVGWVVSYFGFLAFGDPSKGGSRLPLAVTVLPQIHRLCLQARDALGTLYTYTDTQVPFRYVHLISLIVWVHNIVQALNSSVVVKQALTTERHGPSLFIEIVLLFFYPLVYLGLINAGASMLNPLWDKTDVDMPRGAFTYYMFLENRAFFKGCCEPTGPPWGEATTWDPAAVRQTAFAFHLPPTQAH